MTIYAKPNYALLAHTVDVVESATLLFKPGTRLANCWKRFFGIPDENEFFRYLYAAAWLHDIGKANDAFQDCLKNGTKQSLRHEHISALIMQVPEVKAWLAPLGFDYDLLTSVVVGHHLKVAPNFGNVKNKYELLFHGGVDVKIATTTDDFHALFVRIGQELTIGAPPKLPAMTLSSKGWPDPNADQTRRALNRVDGRISHQPTVKFLMAVKSALIIADAVGSAFIRYKAEPVKDWIAKCCDHPIDGQYIRDNILDPVKQRIPGFQPRQVQTVARTLPSRSMLLAPCGDGKTIAGWEWAASQLDARPASNVIFLYPTRSATNQGFDKYVAHAPYSDIKLKHAIANYSIDKW